jgi:hypothetical protein
MHKISPILALVTAFMASSCVYQPKATRYSTTSSRPLTIWERAFPDYDSRRFPGYQTAGADRYSADGIFRSSQGGYRVYTGVSGIPDTSYLYQPAPLPAAAYGSPGDRGSDRNAYAETRHLTGPTLSSGLAPRSEVSPVNRSALQEVRENWRRPASTSRQPSAADRLASATSSRGGQSTARDQQPRSEESHSNSGSAAVDTSRLPYAQPVPGKTGYVKLSDHPNLPDIDVRGIAPGTPVEVPDPARSGQTIQFRVP